MIRIKNFPYTEIGEQCLKVIEEKQKREIEEALRLQALKLEEECESKIRDAVHASRDENENYCKGVVGTLMEHFEKCFNVRIFYYKKNQKKKMATKILTTQIF